MSLERPSLCSCLCRGEDPFYVLVIDVILARKHVSKLTEDRFFSSFFVYVQLIAVVKHSVQLFVQLVKLALFFIKFFN